MINARKIPLGNKSHHAGSFFNANEKNEAPHIRCGLNALGAVYFLRVL